MFQDRVSEALAKGDARFFMSAEQRALERQLDEVQSLLAELPDDASTARQRNTYRRMRAYLDWWIADDYGVNRWAAQKQLRALNREMALFESQRQRVDILMADDDHHAHLARRIAEKERELAAIDQEVSQALAAARGALMSQVDKRLVARQKELKGYLLAARHAQARLADQLFQASQQSGVDHD